MVSAGAAMAGPPAGQAATYQVTQRADHVGACDSRCALREAIMAANGTLADDRVKVPEGTYTLSITSMNGLSGCDGDAEFGDLDICRDGGELELLGAGAKRTVIDADGIDRVLQIWSDDEAPGPAARISGVTLTGGRSLGSEGGGLRVDSSRPTTVLRTVISGNRTFGVSLGSGPDGGGISNAADLTLKRTTVRGNSTGTGGDGGGIANQNAITIRASTIAGNVANDGGNDGDAGGLNNTGTATIVNSTFSGNRAGEANSSDGGAIYTDGDLTLLSSTVAFNTAESGGGIAAVSRPENLQTIENTILARNSLAAGGLSNCGGFLALISLGHNLEQGTTCGFAGPGDITGRARLGALADNGGPTKTHALGRRSAAIGGAKNSTCPPTDQRGVRRPQGRRCDIGAYERKRRRG